jgi:hypothetical protein
MKFELIQMIVNFKICQKKETLHGKLATLYLSNELSTKRHS